MTRARRGMLTVLAVAGACFLLFEKQNKQDLVGPACVPPLIVSAGHTQSLRVCDPPSARCKDIALQLMFRRTSFVPTLPSCLADPSPGPPVLDRTDTAAVKFPDVCSLVVFHPFSLRVHVVGQ